MLVHASLNSIGKFPDRANIFVQTFLEHIGEEGTLLMPSLSYKTVNKSQPVFNEQNTASCVGALTEFFRTYPGVKRSIHPTHSVCGIGAKATFLLKDHFMDETPCGPYSPFARLPLVGGKSCSWVAARDPILPCMQWKRKSFHPIYLEKK